MWEVGVVRMWNKIFLWLITASIGGESISDELMFQPKIYADMVVWLEMVCGIWALTLWTLNIFIKTKTCWTFLFMLWMKFDHNSLKMIYKIWISPSIIIAALNQKVIFDHISQHLILYALRISAYRNTSKRLS